MSPPVPERIPIWQTLRGRLTTILFVALMPVLAFSLAETAREVVNARIARRLDLERQADVLTGEYENVFDSAFQVMTLLKRQPEIENPLDTHCPGTMIDALAAFADFADISVADPSGKIVCRAVAAGVPALVGQFDWFQRLRRTNQPVVGGPIPGPDREPALVSAEPLPFDNGAAIGAIYISIDRAFLDRLKRVAEIPAGTELYLLGSDGRVLIGPATAVPEDALPSAADLGEILKKPGDAYQAMGQNGRSYLYVANPIHRGEVLGLLVRGSDGFRLGPFMSALGQIALPVLLTALALFIVWIATDRIIVRWVRHLRAVAISYRRGNMNVRTRNIEQAPRELAQLGLTLDQMAGSIVDREASLVEHIAQRETLLREIHHRVKNNLQIITSLLNLQVRSADTEIERLLIRDIQARVDALALVYRSAYGAQNLVLIDLRELLPALVDQVARYFHSDQTEVEISTEIEEAHLNIDEAIPLAQLVTEAVSNAFRHAFPGRATGKVQVTLTRENDTTAKLTIRDNGVGLPADLASRPSRKRNGQMLITAFAKQIGGSADFQSDGGGTAIVMDLPYRPPPAEAA